MIRIGSIVIDCDDFSKMDKFWNAALHYESRQADKDDPCAFLKDPSGKGPNVTIDQMKPIRGRIHLDLFTDEPEEEIKRLVSLGATVFQPNEPGGDFTILADPEGNLFCVVDERK